MSEYVYAVCLFFAFMSFSSHVIDCYDIFLKSIIIFFEGTKNL